MAVEERDNLASFRDWYRRNGARLVAETPIGGGDHSASEKPRRPALIFDDEDFTARLTDVLGEAAQRSELSWREVEAVQVLVERYGHLASETYWSIYLALDGAPAEKRARFKAPDQDGPAARERLLARLGELQGAAVA